MVLYTFLFYGSFILSTIVVIMALLVLSWQIMLVGAFLSLPYVLYLSATPRFSYFFVYPIILIVISIFLFCGDKKIKKRRKIRGITNNDWW